MLALKFGLCQSRSGYEVASSNIAMKLPTALIR